jgi:RNA polymerase-binding protein DksA
VTAGVRHKGPPSATLRPRRYTRPVMSTKKAPKGITKKMLPSLRRELEEEREQLLEHARQLEADFRDESWKERRSDDEAELGSAISERERAMSLAQHARTQLAGIEEALARMDEGTYGTCVECGQLIERARLEARPQSLLCLACQRARERVR